MRQVYAAAGIGGQIRATWGGSRIPDTLGGKLEGALSGEKARSERLEQMESTCRRASASGDGNMGHESLRVKDRLDGFLTKVFV
jgi:hypothetical protein